MKAKNLVILVIAAAVLAGLAVIQTRQKDKQKNPQRVKILADLPVNDVAKMVFYSSETTVTVAKAEGAWIVENRFNYPANFDKVADLLRELADIKPGQSVPAKDEQLGELKLESPLDAQPPADGEEKTGAGDKIGHLVVLLGADGKEIGSLLVGKEYVPKVKRGSETRGWDSYGSKGRYVRAQNGNVALIAESLADATIEKATDWLDSEFINVGKWDITALSVTGGTNREPITLTRESESRPLAFATLPKDKEMNATEVGTLSGALSYLKFADVADPALPDAKTGLDNPVVYAAKTKDGRTFTVTIGGQAPEDGGKYYARVAVAYEAPEIKIEDEPEPAEEQKEEKPEKELTEEELAAKKQTEEAEAKKKEDERKKKIEEEKEKQEKLAKETRTLNEKLSKWVYLLEEYKVKNMLLERKDLLKDKEDEKDKDEDEDEDEAPRPKQKKAEQAAEDAEDEEAHQGHAHAAAADRPVEEQEKAADQPEDAAVDKADEDKPAEPPADKAPEPKAKPAGTEAAPAKPKAEPKAESKAEPKAEPTPDPEPDTEDEPEAEAEAQ